MIQPKRQAAVSVSQQECGDDEDDDDDDDDDEGEARVWGPLAATIV